MVRIQSFIRMLYNNAKCMVRINSLVYNAQALPESERNEHALF